MLLKKSMSFADLCELCWTDEISIHVLRSLEEKRRNKVKLIPLTSACKLLTDHLKVKYTFDAFKVTISDREAYSDLCETALSQTIILTSDVKAKYIT